MEIDHPTIRRHLFGVPYERKEDDRLAFRTLPRDQTANVLGSSVWVGLITAMVSFGNSGNTVGLMPSEYKKADREGG